MKLDRIVTPGEIVGVIEQYVPGAGTISLGDGKIVAIRAGYLAKDEKSMEIKVLSPLCLPRRGDVIVGEIAMVMSGIAIVDIMVVNNKVLPYKLQGTIDKRNITFRIRDMSQVLEEGDIVRAEIIKYENGDFLLDIMKPELGVIHSTCRYCGGKLIYGGLTASKCTKCNIEIPKKMSVMVK
ncbi:MAG: exosome complex RNA-binding protein Csl4 [Candidatus Korarchaeota archaeon]